MNKPEVSIVIPCYNAGNFLHRAIDSVLRQTFKNWELILVDNNSSDNTLSVIESYISKYPNKITFFPESKQGGCAARNKGLANANAKWIQFLDADDEILQDKLERQIKLVDNVEIIVGRFARVVNIKGVRVKLEKNLDTSSIWKGLITARLGITSSNLFKKSHLERIGGWNEMLTSSQEYDMMFRMIKNNGRVRFDSSKVSAYIYYENNSVTRNFNYEKNIKTCENYIGLRFEIKKFLSAEKLLTSGLEHTINIYIYNYLADKKNILNEYVENKMVELNLNISSINKFRHQLKLFVKNAINKLSN